MAVLVTMDHVREAVKSGRLMLLKRVNSRENVGKDPCLVMAEELNRLLNPLPTPPVDGARLRVSPPSKSSS